MTRLMLAHMLKPTPPLPQPETSYRTFEGAWPSHITQVTWFNAERPMEEVVRTIAPAMVGFSAVKVALGETKIGADGSVLRGLLDREALFALHQKLLAVVTANYQIEDPRWMGREKFLHFSGPSQTLELGNEAVVNSLVLIESISQQPKVRSTVYRFETL